TCDRVLSEDDVALPMEARLHVARTRLELRTLQGEPIAKTLEDAMALLAKARAGGDKRGCVSLLTIVSDAHHRLNDWREAHRLAREAHVLAESLDDLELRAETMMRLGTTLWEQSPDEALEHFRSARLYYESLGNKYGQLRCMVNAGIARARLGDTAGAELSYREAADLAEASHIGEIAGLAALNLGVLRLRSGEHEAAGEQFVRALRQFAKVKSEPRRLAALYNLANLAQEQGDPAAALERFQGAVELATELGMHDVRVGALAGVGCAALEMGSTADAERIFTDLIVDPEATGASWFQGKERVEAFIIRVYISRGDLVAAMGRLNRALRAAREERYGSLWLTADAVPALAHAECPVPYDLVAEARRDAELAGFRPLVKRLSAFSVPARNTPSPRGPLTTLVTP
ncbi:MAG: tetratricopeptide repeat protein, partial [Gemmatimonadaceae bacterium]